jgi:hypothetical protein
MLLNRTDSRLLRGVVAVSKDEAASSPAGAREALASADPSADRVIGGLPSTLVGGRRASTAIGHPREPKGLH